MSARIERVVDLVEELERMVAAVAATDPRDLDDPALLATTLRLERISERVGTLRLACLGEADHRQLTDRTHGLPTAAYIARETNTSPARLRRDVRAGRTVRDFPAMRAAVAAGDLSTDHLRALGTIRNPRVSVGLQAIEAHLVETATATRYQTWTGELRDLVSDLDQDGGHDPTADEPVAAVRLATTLDGLLELTGTLPGADGLAVRTALEARADELFRDRQRDATTTADLPLPGRPTLLADALVDLLLAGRAVDRRTHRPPRPEATVLIHADEPTATHDPHGVRLQDGSYQRLRCDALLWPIVVSSLGVPLDLGRAARLATDGQRRAVFARDGGCTFPGCDRDVHWCDVHHVDPWEAGGRTDTARLACLCRYHHGVTHRRGWTMNATPDGWFQWTTPSGDRIESQRHGRTRAGPTRAGPTTLAA